MFKIFSKHKNIGLLLLCLLLLLGLTILVCLYDYGSRSYTDDGTNTDGALIVSVKFPQTNDIVRLKFENKSNNDFEKPQFQPETMIIPAQRENITREAVYDPATRKLDYNFVPKSTKHTVMVKLCYAILFEGDDKVALRKDKFGQVVGKTLSREVIMHYWYEVVGKGSDGRGGGWVINGGEKKAMLQDQIDL